MLNYICMGVFNLIFLQGELPPVSDDGGFCHRMIPAHQTSS